MRKLLPVVLALALLGGCTSVRIPNLEDEEIPAVSVARQTARPTQTRAAAASSASVITVEEKLASISFQPISGNYARKCVQDDTEYTELFVSGTGSFARMASGESEEEIFVYSYTENRFTYLYYFSGDLISRAVYDFGMDQVVEDEGGLMDALKEDALLLREYCISLIEQAGLTTHELIKGGL